MPEVQPSQNEISRWILAEGKYCCKLSRCSQSSDKYKRVILQELRDDDRSIVDDFVLWN